MDNLVSNEVLSIGAESMKQHVARLRAKNKAAEVVIKKSKLRLVRLHSGKCELSQHLKVAAIKLNDARIIVESQEIQMRKVMVSQMRACIRFLKGSRSDEQS